MAAICPPGQRTPAPEGPNDRVSQRCRVRPAGSDPGECRLSHRPRGIDECLPAQPEQTGTSGNGAAGDVLRLKVQDWGIGFDPGEVEETALVWPVCGSGHGCWGAASAREKSALREGTRITAELPLVVRN